MSNISNSFIPWQERLYLSLDEVGVLFSRTPDWVRSRIVDRHLKGVRLMKGGPMMVPVASVLALDAKIQGQDIPPVRPAEPAPRAYPQLAWVNRNQIN